MHCCSAQCTEARPAMDAAPPHLAAGASRADFRTMLDAGSAAAGSTWVADDDAQTEIMGTLAIRRAPPAGAFSRRCCFGCGPPGPASHFNNIGNGKYIKWACKPCDNARRQWEAPRGHALRA